VASKLNTESPPGRRERPSRNAAALPDVSNVSLGDDLIVTAGHPAGETTEVVQLNHGFAAIYVRRAEPKQVNPAKTAAVPTAASPVGMNAVQQEAFSEWLTTQADTSGVTP